MPTAISSLHTILRAASLQVLHRPRVGNFTRSCVESGYEPSSGGSPFSGPAPDLNTVGPLVFRRVNSRAQRLNFEAPNGSGSAGSTASTSISVAGLVASEDMGSSF